MSKRKTRIYIERDMLTDFCLFFLTEIREKDDFISASIRLKGLKSVADEMKREISTRFDKAESENIIVTENNLFDVLEALRDTYLENLLGQMVDEGLLKEEIGEDGEILYTATDKLRNDYGDGK